MTKETIEETRQCVEASKLAQIYTFMCFKKGTRRKIMVDTRTITCYQELAATVHHLLCTL